MRNDVSMGVSVIRRQISALGKTQILKPSNRKLPTKRWRLSAAVRFIYSGDPLAEYQPDDFALLKASQKRILTWLHDGKLKGYGRLFQGHETSSLDQDREFEPIEPERWSAGGWEWHTDILRDGSFALFRDIFVDKSEVIQLAAPAADDGSGASEFEPPKVRGRRPLHDREEFWRIATATFAAPQKQASFVADIQQAYILLKDPEAEAPAETYLKERWTELNDTLAKIATAKGKP